MATRRRRSRRRRSLSARLRRHLIEHRFNAAQGLLGVCALSASLWLLWPPAQTAGVDHVAPWERSLQRAEQSFEGRTEAFREGLLAVTEASLAMSAKGQRARLVGSARHSRRPGVRLAQIARTMPAIGVPDRHRAPAAAPTCAVDLPRLRGGAGGRPRRAILARRPRALRGASANLTVAQLLPHRPPSDLGRRTPTWLRNAVATPPADGRPMIAMVIDDLGSPARQHGGADRHAGSADAGVPALRRSAGAADPRGAGGGPRAPAPCADGGDRSRMAGTERAVELAQPDRDCCRACAPSCAASRASSGSTTTWARC